MSINRFTPNLASSGKVGAGMTASDLLGGLGAGNTLGSLGLPTNPLVTTGSNQTFFDNPMSLLQGNGSVIGASNPLGLQTVNATNLAQLRGSTTSRPQLTQASTDLSQVLGTLVTMLTALLQALQPTDNTSTDKPALNQASLNKKDKAGENQPEKPTGVKPENKAKTEDTPKTEDKQKEESPKTENNPPVTASSDVGNAEQREFLDLVNKARAENGLQPVKLNNELNKAATDYSTSLKNANAFEHGLNGTNPGSRAKAAGYGSEYVGENLAKGTQDVKSTFEMWMNSPGHRANILKPEYTEIGLGRDGDVWTQTLGRP